LRKYCNENTAGIINSTGGNMTAQEIQNSSPLDLQGIAQTIVDECGVKGAIVITCGEKGIRVVGVGDLKPEEFREALQTAIEYSYSLSDKKDN
jgi:hypothetical protein